MRVLLLFCVVILPVYLWGQEAARSGSRMVTPAAFSQSAPLGEKYPLLPPSNRPLLEEAGQIQPQPGYKVRQVPETTGQVQRYTGKESITLVNQFEGLNSGGVSPNPDTEGDVGPDHYFQMVKYTFAIWDKEGTLLYGPANNKTLWDDLPGPWNALPYYTDPIVLYDHLSDRWLASCMVYDIPNTYFEMVAVSQTGDPLGIWNLYAYEFANMPDYPKFGIWPDGYYMTVNEYEIDSTYNSYWKGLTVMVFNREDLMNGIADARTVKFHLEPTSTSIWEDPSCFLPCDLDGAMPPPPGTPNYLACIKSTAMGSPEDRLMIWKCTIDWTDSTQCMLSQDNLISVSPFICHLEDQNQIVQPGTSQLLFSMNDRLMMRLQYRNHGAYQSMVTNHSVDVDGNSHYGMRWYELRNSGNGWALFQEGTYVPEPDNRWMGSVAMDGNGNIAAGYSVSGLTLYPSVRITGRHASDPPGIFSYEETELATGNGIQVMNSRWGDYSMMAVDPQDDLTFWYTQEYMPETGSVSWSTSIASFRIDSVLVTGTALPKQEVQFLVYPNPVSEEAILHIEIDQSEKVSVRIYDLSMKPVSTILDHESLPAGQHRFHWIRATSEGIKLPGGVYLCEYTSGSKRIIKKLILD